MPWTMFVSTTIISRKLWPNAKKKRQVNFLKIYRSYMSVGDFIKKILGLSVEPNVKPIKPDQEKTVGDLDYELAKRRAREQRENSAIVMPDEPSDRVNG